MVKSGRQQFRSTISLVIDSKRKGNERKVKNNKLPRAPLAQGARNYAACVGPLRGEVKLSFKGHSKDRGGANQ